MGKFRPLTRRSFLARVAGGAAAIGAAGLTGCATGPYTGATDSDPFDAVGHGRSGGYGGSVGSCSDSDSGLYADAAGGGRRCGGYEPGYTGITDNDGGSYADRANYGRGGSRSCSDSDSGPWADPGGQGRRC